MRQGDPVADAYSLWLHARSAVTAAVYPPRVDYTIEISGFDGEVPVSDHYRASCDPGDGALRVFPISDEQSAKPPPVPRGVNVSFNIGLCLGACAGVRIPIGHPPPNQDLLGVPLLAPAYMFGMRYPQSVAPAAPSSASALRTIAIVTAQRPDYRVQLIDMPIVGGAPTYHLRLTPLRRPKNNRLRELWIGVDDYLPRRAVIAGNFTEAPLVDVPWAVDFSVIGGAPFLERETTERTLYLAHRRVVRDAVIAFENVRKPSDLYDEPLIEPETPDSSLVEPGS